MALPTMFPQPLMLAGTFDPQLAYQVRDGATQPFACCPVAVLRSCAAAASYFKAGAAAFV